MSKQVIFRIPEAKAEALFDKAKASGKSVKEVLEGLVDSYLINDNSIDNIPDASDNSIDNNNYISDNFIDNIPDASNNCTDNTLEKMEALIEERLTPLQAKIEEQQQEIRELRADYRELRLEQREAKLDQKELSLSKNDNTSDNIEDNKGNASDNTNVIQKDKPRVVSNSGDSNGINGSTLAKRLGVAKSTISRKNKQANFSEYTKGKDPDGKAWRYDQELQLFFTVEDGDDQTDCKANHKPSDGDRPISNDDKCQSELLESVPSVGQQDLCLDQTPLNGSPKHGASHKDEMAHHTA